MMLKGPVVPRSGYWLMLMLRSDLHRGYMRIIYVACVKSREAVFEPQDEEPSHGQSRHKKDNVPCIRPPA